MCVLKLNHKVLILCDGIRTSSLQILVVFFYTTTRTGLCITQHKADSPILHSYVHIQDHKHADKNGNIPYLISTKLSKIVESSVQQLMYKTVLITTSFMQTEHTSINYAPGTHITRQMRHQINEDLTPTF